MYNLLHDETPVCDTYRGIITKMSHRTDTSFYKNKHRLLRTIHIKMQESISRKNVRCHLRKNAVNIERALDHSTAEFLSVLKRFVGRRARVNYIQIMVEASSELLRNWKNLRHHITQKSSNVKWITLLHMEFHSTSRYYSFQHSVLHNWYFKRRFCLPFDHSVKEPLSPSNILPGTLKLGSTSSMFSGIFHYPKFILVNGSKVFHYQTMDFCWKIWIACFYYAIKTGTSDRSFLSHFWDCSIQIDSW